MQSIGKDKATILHKIFEVLTFKDLKRRVTLQATTQEHKALERLHDRPFWIWNVEEHKQEDIDTKGDCCFNHISPER